jgi:hypothetical protein
LFAIQEIALDETTNVAEDIWHGLSSRDVDLGLDPFGDRLDILTRQYSILSFHDGTVGLDHVFARVCALGRSVGAELPLTSDIASLWCSCSDLAERLGSRAWIDVDGVNGNGSSIAARKVANELPCVSRSLTATL